MLTAALKHGRFFLEAFLRSGIPVINALFKNKKVCYRDKELSAWWIVTGSCLITPSIQEEVLALLKSLQRSTRCLQHFCLHSKFSRNTVLTRHVPRLKRCLEAFLFSIKVSEAPVLFCCCLWSEKGGVLCRGSWLITELWIRSGLVFSRTGTCRWVWQEEILVITHALPFSLSLSLLGSGDPFTVSTVRDKFRTGQSPRGRGWRKQCRGKWRGRLAQYSHYTHTHVCTNRPSVCHTPPHS